MATTRISALTELTNPASTDVLVINDVSVSSTKKIQLSNLIPDDAIDSEHYVAGSIDNEHLANDAVDSDELASGAVDIAHLSATGTPGTDFLRGDNTWATPTDTNTMGSGFTVSATTDSNATTITQGDDLMFTAGTGITTETTADGTVTIASTVTDTNTMGSGFTVSATTDSNATTITQGDDLMFTAGTGITCETTADGTVTITNTTSGASTATSSATGLIKIEDDTDQSVAAESVSTTANRTYGLQLNSSDQGVVNVPWTDTNTTYSAGDFKLDDLDAPDDNTDLDFTTSAHGLVPKGTNTGDFLKDDGTWASAGGGKILQVVSNNFSNMTDIASTSFQDVGGSPTTIQPSSTTSKILILVNVQALIRLDATDDQRGDFEIERDGTPVESFADIIMDGRITYTSAHKLFGGGFAFSYLDAPTSTSSLVYSLTAKCDTTADTGRIKINQTATASRSTITLMEVAG